MNEDELERLAAEELLKEAKQGAARAVVHGALGWKKESVPRPNKRFLSTTLANTMQYNYRRSRSSSPHRRHKSCSRNTAHHSTHHNKAHKKPRINHHSRQGKQTSDRSTKLSERNSTRKDQHHKEVDRRTKREGREKRKSRSH